MSQPAMESQSFDPARNPLTIYFRNIAKTKVLSQVEEIDLANRIAELRRTLWYLALDYPPFITGIAELTREILGDDHSPGALLAAMTDAARNLRDRDLRTHRLKYAAARQHLSVALADCDLDGLVMDHLLADLGTIQSGGDGPLRMRVKLPPRGSLPFISYVAALRGPHVLLSAAISEFVQANLRLVVTIARRFNRGRLPLQDLVQEGNLGLLKAVTRYDVRKGCRFSTYGAWWIRHAITRALADKARTVRLPVHMCEAQSKVSRVNIRFQAAHGRLATDSELVAETGVSRERLARMQLSVAEQPVSLDDTVMRGSSLTLLDAIEDMTQAPAPELLDHATHMEHLQDVLRALTPFEAEILARRIGMDDQPEMTLKEIGAQYGLSRERIRQLQEQAVGKLREEFRARGLL
jgi:RNA polymerase primary sigma factor